MKKFDRVTSILIYLQTKSVVTASELATRFDVSDRTIYRDLRTLENAGVPIGAEVGVGYFLDKSYRLPPVVFTREEGASLLFGSKMIENRVDAAIREEYLTALDKIRSVMESEDQDYLTVIDDAIAVYTPEASDNIAGQDAWLAQCRTSLTRSQVVMVEYDAGSSHETVERELEPIGLYYYSNHWHLIAWCRLREDYRDFRLDRIKTLTFKPEQFVRREHASLQEYLEREANAELHEVVITFSFDTVRFVGEQRYHFGFVREHDTDEGVEMTFVTPHLEYLGRWLLQFTSGASTRNNQLRAMMNRHAMELAATWTHLV